MLLAFFIVYLSVDLNPTWTSTCKLICSYHQHCFLLNYHLQPQGRNNERHKLVSHSTLVDIIYLLMTFKLVHFYFKGLFALVIAKLFGASSLPLLIQATIISHLGHGN